MEIKDRSQLITEQRNPRTLDIDCKTTLEMVDCINAEDARVITAVQKEREPIAKAVDLAVDALKGRRQAHLHRGRHKRAARYIGRLRMPPDL